MLKLLDLYPFSFIYEIKTEEFTKARFDHAFDYVHADPAASRRKPLNDPPNPNGFGAQTMQTSATNLPAAASKDLQPVGSVRER